jgi:hypothetical protein
MPIHEVIPHRMRETDEVRRRALERLYLRKAAVDELIESLQNYQRAQRAKAPVMPFSVARKCS